MLKQTHIVLYTPHAYPARTTYTEHNRWLHTADSTLITGVMLVMKMEGVGHENGRCWSRNTGNRHRQTKTKGNLI